MTPSFQPGDRLLASPGAYGHGPPARGDAVIVDSPGAPGERYLKRIVGLPGEEVRLSEGYLLIDGEHLVEPYLAGLPAVLGLEERTWKLAQDEIFVIGDNLNHSSDSTMGPALAFHLSDIRGVLRHPDLSRDWSYKGRAADHFYD